MSQLPIVFPEPRYVTVECRRGEYAWTHLVDERTAVADCRQIERDLPGAKCEVMR